MLRTVGRVFVCVWLLAGASAAGAEPARLALLIGNQSYAPSVGVLQNPHNDIELVGKALARQGFTVLPLVKDATRLQILAAIREFSARLNRAGVGATGFLYYAGHGATEPGTDVNYLIPVDARLFPTEALKKTGAASIWDQSVKLDEVLGILASAPSAAKFVVFDACRSELRLPVRGSNGFSPVSERSGMLVAFSAAPNQPASDGEERNGPYAAALAAELAKPGNDQYHLFHEVQDAVLSATNGVQHPWFSAGIRGYVYLNQAKDGTLAEAQAQLPPAAAKPAREQAQPADQQWIANQDRVEIEFLTPVAEDFSKGKAGKCRFPATFRNLSRYHINRMIYKVRDWDLSEEEISANKSRTKDRKAELALKAGQLCSDEANRLLESLTTTLRPDRCSMEGQTEGECQDMVHISAKFGVAEVEAIRHQEADAQKNYSDKVEADRIRKEAEERARQEKQRAEERQRAAEIAKVEAKKKADEAKKQAEDEQRRAEATRNAERDRKYWDRVLDLMTTKPIPEVHSNSYQVLVIAPSEAFQFDLTKDGLLQNGFTVKGKHRLSVCDKLRVGYTQKWISDFERGYAQAMKDAPNGHIFGWSSTSMVPSGMSYPTRVPDPQYDWWDKRGNYYPGKKFALVQDTEVAYHYYYVPKENLLPAEIYDDSFSCEKADNSFYLTLDERRLTKGELPTGPMSSEDAERFGPEIRSIEW